MLVVLLSGLLPELSLLMIIAVGVNTVEYSALSVCWKVLRGICFRILAGMARWWRETVWDTE